MSKELIENLRKDGKFLGGNFGKLMQEAADALEAKAAPVGVPVYQLQCREIGEGDWCPADLRHYTYCQRAPEMDTRIVEVQQAGAAYQRQSGVPDGFTLVPDRMHLDSSVIESIQVHCGDGQEDAGYGPYADGILWIGECEEEDGSKTYGLHIATADYPEHGSTTLVAFARLNGAGSHE